MFHHNRSRRSRATAATAAAADGGPHSSDDEYDDEVFYREQSQTRGNVNNQGQGHLFGGLARFGSQSQTQQPQPSQSPSVTSATSSEVATGGGATSAAGAAHPVLLMPRHERRRRAREMVEREKEYYQQGASMSSSSESSQAESSAPENAFASLELLLNQQQRQQEKQPEESSMAPPPEPQVDLLPSDIAHTVPHNDEPPIAEKLAPMEAHGNNTTSLHRSSPPTLSAAEPNSAAGFTNDAQGPLIPEAASAHTATGTDTTAIPTGSSPGDAASTNDSGAHDHDDAGQAGIETDPSGGGMPEESNLSTSQATVHTSHVSTKTSTKRSRGRDQYKHNVPTPSYTSFSSPGRNSGNTSSSTRRMANSQLDPPPSSLLETTRRIAMKQAKTSVAVAAAAAAASTSAKRGRGANISGTQQRTSQRSLKPVSIVNSKSIVGTRPKHWGGSTVRTLGSTGRTNLVSAGKRSSLAAELSKAAQTRTLMPPPPRTTTFKRARTEERSSFPAPRASGASTEALAQPSSMDTSALSFTPAFLSSRLRTKTVSEEDHVDGTESFPDSMLTLSPRLGSPTGMYSPPSRKTGKSKISKAGPGPLSKRLKMIRDGVKGDSVRFQCGQYPFSAKAAFDMNDPRNRSKSYMDVTVMGDSCPWAKDSSQRLTVLAFIHTHEPTTTKQQAAAVDAAFDCKKCMVWLCFSFETAREQNLRIGSELRIYNAVAIPVASKSDAKDPVDFIVLCTQLCEPYPAVLPKLPEVASITSMVDQNIET